MHYRLELLSCLHTCCASDIERGCSASNCGLVSVLSHLLGWWSSRFPKRVVNGSELFGPATMAHTVVTEPSETDSCCREKRSKK